MNVVFGNDHRGIELKEYLMIKVMEWGSVGMTFNVGAHHLNVGAHNNNGFDYPYASKMVAEKVGADFDFGVLICGSGFGVNIAVNRWPGIRAVTCRTQKEAVAARLHNNANVICLGADFTNERRAGGIVQAFLEAPFDGGERHQRRIELIDSLVE